MANKSNLGFKLDSILFFIIIVACLVLSSMANYWANKAFEEKDLDAAKNQITSTIAIVALMVSGFSMFNSSQSIRRAQRIEEMRKIEKSLEYFYRPLQNQLISYEENPTEASKGMTNKLHEIGRYRHLATLNTLSCFELCTQCSVESCTQYINNLQKLKKKVDIDIEKLQEDYKN